MIIIDGKDVILGRLATLVAKEALRGEEVAVVNCEQIIVTGSKRSILEKFEEKRHRVGSTQKGPKVVRTNEQIVKIAIRGMLPNPRRGGRGREALKRIKCYVGVPKEFAESKKILIEKKMINKGIKVKEMTKQ
jgi:large subunit ribosomal protein L13